MLEDNCEYYVENFSNRLFLKSCSIALFICWIHHKFDSTNERWILIGRFSERQLQTSLKLVKCDVRAAWSRIRLKVFSSSIAFQSDDHKDIHYKTPPASWRWFLVSAASSDSEKVYFRPTWQNNRTKLIKAEPTEIITALTKTTVLGWPMGIIIIIFRSHSSRFWSGTLFLYCSCPSFQFIALLFHVKWKSECTLRSPVSFGWIKRNWQTNCFRYQLTQQSKPPLNWTNGYLTL